MTGPSRCPHSALGSESHPGRWSGAPSGPEAQRPAAHLPWAPDHGGGSGLQPGASRPAPGGWHRWVHAYLPLGGGPEVDLTELHGLLQGGLLVHLSKDMPEVSGP